MTENPAREAVYARAPKDVKAAALAVLGEQGWPIDTFVVACLVAVADQPDLLKTLAQYRPAPRPPGRPRKGTGE